MKICLYFTNDLMFSSRVKPVANEAGYELQFPGFQSISFEPKPDLVIFDLEYASQSDLTDVLEKLKSLDGDLPKTVAYAPHVKTSLLEIAEQAGVDLVWSRGQFNKNIATLFQS